MGSIVIGFPSLFFASQQLMVTALDHGILDSATEQAVQSVLKDQTDLVHITANMAPREWKRFAARSIAVRLHSQKPLTELKIMNGQGNKNSSQRGAYLFAGLGSAVSRMDIHREKGVMAMGGAGGVRGATMSGVARSSYFPDTNSAIISIDHPSPGCFVWDNSDVMLWFDNDRQWVGFDLDLKDLASALNVPPRNQRILFTPETLAPFVLQSVGLHCEIENDILKVRFKKDLEEKTSLQSGVNLNISKDGISGFEFFFNNLVPDMFQRIRYILS